MKQAKNTETLTTDDYLICDQRGNNNNQGILNAAELHECMAKSWKESAETSVADIESITEALSDGDLSIADARTFRWNLERMPTPLRPPACSRRPGGNLPSKSY